MVLSKLPPGKDEFDYSEILEVRYTTLTAGERRVLKAKRNKKIAYITTTYLILLGILVAGVDLAYEDAEGPQKRFDPELLKTVGPMFLIGMWIILTIYFTKWFFQDAHSFTKDLKSNQKKQTYFVGKKYVMPFFNKYYLYLPHHKQPQVQLPAEDFAMIPDQAKFLLETGKYSGHILCLSYNGKQIYIY